MQETPLPPENDPASTRVESGGAPEPLSPTQRRKIYWLGVGAACVVAVIAGFVLPRVFDEISRLGGVVGQGAGYFGWLTFLGIPVAMGALAAWLWKPLKMTSGGLWLGALAITGCGLLAAGFILREGVICLIMASPLVVCMVALGCWLGNWLARLDGKNKRGLYISLAPTLLLLLFHDATSGSGVYAVRDEIRIRATPQAVWKLLPSFPPIREYSPYWLNSIGLPRAVESQTFGSGIGARRECRLQGNLVVGEKISEWTAPRVLAFEVTQQPQHPEIAGHFELLRGRFDVIDNRDGTVTLAGTSWYRLRVQPLAYFHWWADDVIRHLHFDVMRHIKKLAENEPQASATGEILAAFNYQVHPSLTLGVR